MADTLEGLVLDVVDGEVLELEVEHVHADEPGRYGAREFIRLSEGRFADEHAAEDDEAAALMALTYQNRRVRCFVEQRDEEGRIIGEVEVLGPATPDPTYLVTDDD
jgi:hypothetical protein